MCRLTELRCKEVINLRNGERFGYISDVKIDVCSGKVVEIIVPSGIHIPFVKCDEYIIPWCCIEKIGDDIVLVDYDCPPKLKKKRGL